MIRIKQMQQGCNISVVNFINAKKQNDNLSTNIGTVHYKGEN